MASAQVFTKNRVESRTKKCLILTNTGGSGHLQAARSVSFSYQKNHPDAAVFVKDTFEDFLGKPIGRLFANIWNLPQKQGSLLFLGFLGYSLRLAHLVTWLPIFFGVLRILVREKITFVIDTQPLSISAITKAIRVYNFWYRKDLFLEKVLTDLPTENTSLYFPFLKRLSKGDKQILRIKTTHPLLQPGETESAFWKKTCNISLGQIKYTRLPVRQNFLIPHPTKQKTPLSVRLQFPTKEGLDLLLKTASFGNLYLTHSSSLLSFTIEPEDKVALIMMGANPHLEAVLEYVQSFIHLILENKSSERNLLFLFCAKNGQSSLQKSVNKMLLKVPEYPPSLTILPIPYQEESILAPLLYRSDLTLTRSGGITSMELLSSSSKTILIHRGKAPKWLPKFFKKFPTFQEGMPPWERGNARYLEQKRGAKLVTPETFCEVSKEYFLCKEPKKSTADQREPAHSAL